MWDVEQVYWWEEDEVVVRRVQRKGEIRWRRCEESRGDGMIHSVRCTKRWTLLPMVADKHSKSVRMKYHR
jgi:hypothetical protein